VGKDHGCGSECEPAGCNTIEITFEQLAGRFLLSRLHLVSLGVSLVLVLKILAGFSGLILLSASLCRLASFLQ